LFTDNTFVVTTRSYDYGCYLTFRRTQFTVDEHTSQIHIISSYVATKGQRHMAVYFPSLF